MIWEDWAILIVLILTLGLYVEQVVFLPFLWKFRGIGGFKWTLKMVGRQIETDEKIEEIRKEL